MPLRWINYHDIDEAVDETLLATLYEIDNQSLGGKSSNKALTPARKKVVKKSETLKIQLNQINNLASQQSNKIIAFYSDYDRFLAALSRKMKSNAISVWTLGNRKVAKQEIFIVGSLNETNIVILFRVTMESKLLEMVLSFKALVMVVTG